MATRIRTRCQPILQAAFVSSWNPIGVIFHWRNTTFPFQSVPNPAIPILINPNTTPRVSVVMPCYNAGASVRRAINSIQNQTMTDWELVAVDDGSTDDTASQISTLAATDPRIRLLRTRHGGVVPASNAGFRAARAALIARMDADDTSHPHRLEKQHHFLTTHPETGAVSCLAHFAGDPTSAGGYAYHVGWANRIITPEAILLNRFIDLPVPHPTLMYRRELIENHGGYRQGDFPEDYELLLRWADAGVRIHKINETLYHWHDPPNRLSRTDHRYHMDAFHRCKAPYLATAIKKSGCAGRDLWIWGAGRPARKCARHLESAWKPATGFIDIDPKKIGRNLHGRPVVSPDNLPPASQSVIAAYVGTRGARDTIRSALLTTNRTEGTDFWICA